jgi:hypothetical protein
MANNSLLRDFLDLHVGELAESITNKFDDIIENDDATAIEAIKDKLNEILEEKINAID